MTSDGASDRPGPERPGREQPGPERPGRAHRLVVALLVVGVTFALCLLALLAVEGALRLAHVYPSFAVPDTTIGYRFRAGARYRWTDEGFSEGRMNSAGWRDHEYTEQKPAGTTRILFCGDSMTEALQVSLDSTFHKILERELNERRPAGNTSGAPAGDSSNRPDGSAPAGNTSGPAATGTPEVPAGNSQGRSAEHRRHIEVLSLGRSGMGTTEEYLTYRKWGRRYNPDIVAVLFVLNDFVDNTRELDPGRDIRPYFVQQGDSLVLDKTFLTTPGFRTRARLDVLKAHSSIVSLAAKTWNARQRQRGVRILAGRTVRNDVSFDFDARIPADSIPSFRVTRAILARFARDVARDGRRFVVFVVGAARQEDRDELGRTLQNQYFDKDKPQRFLVACGQRDGYEVVPLTPEFRAASGAGRGPFWYKVNGSYGHWNVPGHAVGAEAMRRYFAPPAAPR